MIMRIRTFSVILGLAALLAAPAKADVQSYCELYSKDFADSRTTNVDKWQLLYRSAFGDCMLSYNAKPSADSPATTADQQNQPGAVDEQVEAIAEEPAAAAEKPAAKPKPRKVAAKKPSTRVAARNLIPGSDAWNAYCAAKYSSFNKLSGTYLSNSGKIRRCSTTR